MITVRHTCGVVVAFWAGTLVLGTRVAAHDLRLLDGRPYEGPLVCGQCGVPVSVVAVGGDVVAVDTDERPTAARIDEECIRA